MFLLSAAPRTTTKTTATCRFCRANARSLAPIDIDDLVLVDKLKDVGRVHEDADGTDGGDQEEYPELGTVHHHCHKLPVFSYLQTGIFWLKSVSEARNLTLKLYICFRGHTSDSPTTYLFLRPYIWLSSHISVFEATYLTLQSHIFSWGPISDSPATYLFLCF